MCMHCTLWFAHCKNNYAIFFFVPNRLLKPHLCWNHLEMPKLSRMTTPVGLESTLKFTTTGGYFIQLYTGPLLFNNGGISHNRPQITSDHTIHVKSHNLWRITQFSQNRPKCTQLKKNLIYSSVIFKMIYLGNLQTHWIFACINNQRSRCWYPFLHPQGLVLVFNLEELPIGMVQTNALL